jgi:hypothetical protein
MAERLGNVFLKTVTFSRDYITFPSGLESLDADAALTDGRGRWPRRPGHGRARHGANPR